MKEKELYEFGQFRLDVAERFLARLSGERVSLSQKAFETLCVLVRNKGHLVHKDELMNQVWADAFVEDNNLDKCIYAIRRALGEKPGEQKFIETIRKHGYRFVADVRRLEDEDGLTHEENTLPSKTEPNTFAEFPQSLKQTEPHDTNPVFSEADWRREAVGNEEAQAFSLLPLHGEPTEQTTRLESTLTEVNSEGKRVTKYRLPLVALALAACLIGASALGYYFYVNKKASSVDGTKTIAVLPLKPINAAKRDEIYELGIADSLIHRLSSMKGFIVRPLSATRHYTDIKQNPLAAGREQQVDYVLASNYQLAGGKIRITAQLLNVASGQIEETYTIEKDAANVFAMQDAIADEVGNILLERFAATSSSPVAKRGTTNEEAYRLYLQGRYLVERRTLEGAKKGIEMLEQAVRLDPNYAQAWAGKAHAHRSVANFGRKINIHEEYQKSIEAINKALALDENLASAHTALCENKLYYEYDLAGAERACKRAIELDPNSSLSHQVFSRYLQGRGRFDEAIVETKTAIDLEPASLFSQRNYGDALQYARRYAEAVAQYKRVIAMDPNLSSTYNWLSMTLSLQGNQAEAFEWWMKLQALQKADEETVRNYKTAYQTSGWQGIMRERAKRFDEGEEAYYLGASLYAQVGNKDKAFECLEISYQRREFWLCLLQVDPRLDSLRDDPRFDELVRRIGLK